MNSQFRTGYRCNIYFYIAICIVAIIVGYVYRNVPVWLTTAFIPYAVFSVFCLHKSAKKEKVNYTLYAKMQSIAFLITDIFLSIFFNSAQVFIYAMCFTSILSFVFVDVKLSKFQFLLSLIVAVIAAGFISIYTGSKPTMLAYSFGTLLLVVTNWVIVSMTSHINFQYRKYAEQERSLDDMLKVVEAKCYEAQTATRSKTLFLAQMSHEIRTPINVIVGMNEMILRESKDDSISGYASETKNAAKSLLGIINDILDITKIEAGKLTSIPVKYSLSELIPDIYNLIRFKAEDKGLTFEVKADEKLPSVLVGDDIRLKQIVTNLLTNAVKYTHSGGIVFEIRPDDNGIFFSVKDTGIGIKPEDMNRLFNAFDRMEENKNRSIEGTGLGLNITSSLLKMFGSELKVKSVYGEGSEFYFVIKQEIVDPTPIGKINLTAKNYSEIKYEALSTAPDAKVLIVDDNEMNRKVFSNLLKNTLVQITEASSGKECLRLVAENRFDIVFMDYMMPEMDGVQTLEEMRRMENNLSKDAPVIILTANAVSGAKEFYEKSGFDGFLSKPVSPKKLEQTLFSMLDPALISAESHAEEEAEAELPVINGTDWSYARLHFENDKMISDTVKMFLNALKRDADELDLYFDGIDNDEALNSYRVKVHSMKSSSALIGILQLSGMAMELEEAAKCHDTDIIKAMHPVFIKRWLSYEQLLEEFADNKTADKNADDFRSEINGIIERIRTAAEEMDVDALDSLSAELDGYNFNDSEKEKIKQIKDMIFNFEIDKLKECTI